MPDNREIRKVFMDVKTFLQNNFTDQPPKSMVLGVGGSPRQSGNSDLLLRHILKGVQSSRVETHNVQLRDYYYQPCIGCEKCRKDKICTGLKDGMTLLYPLIYQSRGLVMVCPTHNYNITAWMKAFIDRLYCFYDFENTRPRKWSTRMQGQDRKAVLAAVAEQEDEYDMGFTLEAMHRPLKALGYEVIGQLPVLGIFDRGGVKKKDDVLSGAEKLGRELATALKS
jgi:multimeric flavodoxin WrbA